MGDTTLFASGKEVSGYLNAADDRIGRPAVVAIHEWWGLTDQIRSVVDRLASEGFVAFAPDLYHGRTTNDPYEGARLSRRLDWGEAEVELRAAAQALLARDPSCKVGVMGFCLGGGLALFAAAKISEYSAAVPYYGIGEAAKADLSQIRARVQGHYAQRDGWVTPERVNDLQRRLAAGGVRFEIHRYDADHAFANEQRPEVYSPENAKLAWRRTIQFLREALA